MNYLVMKFDAKKQAAIMRQTPRNGQSWGNYAHDLCSAYLVAYVPEVLEDGDLSMTVGEPDEFKQEPDWTNWGTAMSLAIQDDDLADMLIAKYAMTRND